MKWITILLWATVPCLSLVNWTIEVKTGDSVYDGIPKGRVIQLQDEKGGIQDINLDRKLEVGSTECFQFNSAIIVPSKLTVNKNKEDGWGLDFITFSDGPRHFFFNCKCWIKKKNHVIYVTEEYTTEPQAEVTTDVQAVVTTSKVGTPASRTTQNVSTTTITTRTTSNRPTEISDVINSRNTSGTNGSLCPCDCGSRYYGETGCSLDDVACVLSVLREQLIVDVASTSSFKRTKISAYDGRISSRMIGATGVVFLVAALLIFVIPDIIRMFRYLHEI